MDINYNKTISFGFNFKNTIITLIYKFLFQVLMINGIIDFGNIDLYIKKIFASL